MKGEGKKESTRRWKVKENSITSTRIKDSIKLVTREFTRKRLPREISPHHDGVGAVGLA